MILIKEFFRNNKKYSIFMLHDRGGKVSRLTFPAKAIKTSAVAVVSLLLLASAGFVHYLHTVNQSVHDLAELDQLRMVNSVQAAQLEQLAMDTAKLQEKMSTLNQLEEEVRRLIKNEDNVAISRSGVARPTGSRPGEGGPIVQPRPNELIHLVSELESTVKVRQESLKNLREAMIDRNIRQEATPSIRPCEGEVSSRFGWRWNGSDWHPGLDIAADTGTPIFATAAGTVIASGWNGGYGIQVTINHGYGVTTSYAHNSENAVRVGQKVKKGQLIAYVGNTGFSTGPHLHYEVRINGNAVNPENFL